MKTWELIEGVKEKLRAHHNELALAETVKEWMIILQTIGIMTDRVQDILAGYNLGILATLETLEECGVLLDVHTVERIRKIKEKGMTFKELRELLGECG